MNTSSLNGGGVVAQAPPYPLTKTGILALTKSAALEYSRHGIRINARAAGGFRTPMLESVLDAVSITAVGRIIRPEEAAAAALRLGSDAASYVTGHSMIVDGGLTSWMP